MGIHLLADRALLDKNNMMNVDHLPGHGLIRLGRLVGLGSSGTEYPRCSNCWSSGLHSDGVRHLRLPTATVDFMQHYCKCEGYNTSF